MPAFLGCHQGHVVSGDIPWDLGEFRSSGDALWGLDQFPLCCPSPSHWSERGLNTAPLQRCEPKGERNLSFQFWNDPLCQALGEAVTKINSIAWKGFCSLFPFSKVVIVIVVIVIIGDRGGDYARSHESGKARSQCWVSSSTRLHLCFVRQGSWFLAESGQALALRA